MSAKKPLFASHSKASAAVISLTIHAVLIIVALTFIAVKGIIKDDVDFAAKPVSRPKMNLRKLQVPVNVKKCYRPAMLAMKQQADAVRVLTSWWGEQRILDGDNRQRAAHDEAPRAINRDNPWDMNSAYFPDIGFPPDAEWECHEPRECAEAMVKVAPKSAMPKLGLSRKKSVNDGFSFHVVRLPRRMVNGVSAVTGARKIISKARQYHAGKLRG